MSLASDARSIARAAIRAADPGRAVGRTLRRVGKGVRVGPRALSPATGGEIHVVAVGKAAGAMADAAMACLRGRAEGLVVTPRGYPAARWGLRTVFGDHPVPRVRSFRAGSALLEYVRSTHAEDRILFLVSGGGSAVAEAPVSPLRPSDLRGATEVLLACGAPIQAMNAVRRHLSAVKGGRLALAAGAGAWATVAISDVVGDRPSEIASGPTVPDPTTFRRAVEVVEEYRIASRLPPRVVRFLREGTEGRWPETPKPSERRWQGAPFVLAATNRVAVEAAAAEARRRGYRTRAGPVAVVGETQPAARRFARDLLRGSTLGGPPVALVAGGETTVSLGPRPGRGGRNQEFALAAAPVLAGHPALVLSVGTDGIDGPTDAAGGWTDGRSLARARRRGVDPAAALALHSSHDALRAIGGLLVTGPTGTNVMDVHVGLAAEASPSTAGSSPRREAPSSRRRRS